MKNNAIMCHGNRLDYLASANVIDVSYNLILFGVYVIYQKRQTHFRGLFRKRQKKIFLCIWIHSNTFTTKLKQNLKTKEIVQI